MGIGNALEWNKEEEEAKVGLIILCVPVLRTRTMDCLSLLMDRHAFSNATDEEPSFIHSATDKKQDQNRLK